MSAKDLKVPEDFKGLKDPMVHTLLYTIDASRKRGLIMISRYHRTIRALRVLRAILYYTHLTLQGLEVS